MWHVFHFLLKHDLDIKIMKITIFKIFTQVIGYRTLPEILKAIQQGAYGEVVNAVRRAVERGDKKGADEIKKTLHAFTVSGRFENGRTMERLKEYHPFLVLDIDKLKEEELNRVSKAVRELPYTHSCFLSPSGNGCKIIVKVNSNQSQHRSAFIQVSAYYEKKLRTKIDPSGKDITRLCFFSFDKEAYLNPESKIFQVKETVVKAQPFQSGLKEAKIAIPVNQEFRFRKIELKDPLGKCLRFTQQKTNYVEGNRNNFIYLFASNCNREGISENDTLNFAMQKFDLPQSEIKDTIASSYRHHLLEFGKQTHEYKIKKIEKDDTKIHLLDSLKSTPRIPDKVYRLLPDLLKRGSQVFDEKRERDVFLIGALSVLSGALTKVEGLYDGCVTYPNLFSFIVAPAASGKGVLKFAKMLGAAFHKKLLNENKERYKDYEMDLMDYQMKLTDYKKRKTRTIPDAPEKPARNLLFIPANSSSAMIIQQLKESNGWGVLCESEADTLGNVLKQDWGGYSDLLRKVFHFESISYSRKGNDEYHEISNPRLSVAISGTPNQVLGLIPSAEDGLFSRFIFYVFNVEPTWKKQSLRKGRKNLTAFFTDLSNEVLELLEWLEEHPTKIDLSEAQWIFFDEVLEKMLMETSSLDGEEVLSTVKRLGVILFRIVMVISAIRKYESKEDIEDWICHDDDFQMAMTMIEIFWKHSILLFEHLPKSKQLKMNKLPNGKKLFYQKLPESFKRNEAQTIGESLGLKSRTIDKYLKLFLENLLEQPDYGLYKKI